MNSKERAKQRQSVLESVRDGHLLVGDALAKLDTIERTYQASKENPVYPLVRDMERLTSALLAVANTPSALAGVCRTIEEACAAFRATLMMDATIAEFQAADEMEFKSSEDVNG